MDKEKLKQIGELLLKGMTEKEACILVDIPYSTFNTFKENDEYIAKYIEKQMVKFKLNHIETIQKNKSEKNSMYLLEKLRPAEFGAKSKSEGPTINIISAIIKDIQNDPNSTIVSFNRATVKEAQRESNIKEGALLLN